MRTRLWPWVTFGVAVALGFAILQLFSSSLGRTSIFVRADYAYLVSRRAKPSMTTGLPFPKNWGAYSPAYPRAEYSVPRGCKVSMANILERHGARFPTSGASKRIKAAISKMQAVPEWKDPALNFIKSFVYDLGSDTLLPFGARQSYDGGVQAAQRYKHLGTPFARASGSERVVHSALNWTAGYVKASGIPLPPPLEVSEDDGFNTTLDDSMCPNAESSDAQTTVWQDTFAPRVIARLQSLAEPPNSLALTNVDLPNLMSFCAFHTLASASFGSEPTTSPWCALWTAADTAKFEYWMDLDKYYGTGYGNELGPVQGIGYVNELLARLTRTPVVDNTSTNRTLDSDPETFPLDRELYVDFSHDNQMIPILAALGVLHQDQPHAMDPSRFDLHRTWVASQMVPFAGRVVVEKLSCNGHQEVVRLLVNEKITQLPEPCPRASNGLCSLKTFVRSQSFARGGSPNEWARCVATPSAR